MVKAPYFDRNGMKKGAWSEEEDCKLKTFIHYNGQKNWRLVPIYAGLSRCGKSCRLRWVNYLDPNLKRGDFTKREHDLIIELHKKHGSKWSMIASELPGRTDNDIKNYWNGHINKRSKRNTKVSKVIGKQKIVHDESSNSSMGDHLCMSNYDLIEPSSKNVISSESDHNAMISSLTGSYSVNVEAQDNMSTDRTYDDVGHVKNQYLGSSEAFDNGMFQEMESNKSNSSVNPANVSPMKCYISDSYADFDENIWRELDANIDLHEQTDDFYSEEKYYDRLFRGLPDLSNGMNWI